MGWGPDHPIGAKFIGENDGARKGDIILIARSWKNEPELVGFGVVTEDGYRTTLRGFKPPPSPYDDYYSARILKPFRPWNNVPSGKPFMEVLDHRRAMVELHPEKNKSHRKICAWLERKLASPPPRSLPPPPPGTLTKPGTGQLEYQVRNRAQVKMAEKKEEKLLRAYDRLLIAQGREVSIASFGLLRCDRYEEAAANLIEAKAYASREYVRMAVGQLLDYEYQGLEKFGPSHKAILLPNKPAEDVVEWLRSLNIFIVWRNGRGFDDNADGRFT
jgi:hypothetical protein